MIIPSVQQVKKNLLATLRTISVASGAQYDVFVREGDTMLLNDEQQPIEVTLQARGFRYLPDEETPIGFTDVELLYQVNVLVSHRVAEDDTPIDEICLVVCADVEKAVMADITQGGEAIQTRLQEGTVDDQLAEGSYLWSLAFTVHSRHAIDDPFNNQPE